MPDLRNCTLNGVPLEKVFVEETVREMKTNHQEVVSALNFVKRVWHRQQVKIFQKHFRFTQFKRESYLFPRIGRGCSVKVRIESWVAGFAVLKQTERQKVAHLEGLYGYYHQAKQCAEFISGKQFPESWNSRGGINTADGNRYMEVEVCG